MKFLCLGIVASLLSLNSAFANEAEKTDEAKTLEAHKAQINKSIDERIEALNKFKGCVGGANKKDDIKNCRQDHKNALSEIRMEMKEQQVERLEKKKEKLDEKIKSLQNQKIPDIKK